MKTRFPVYMSLLMAASMLLGACAPASTAVPTLTQATTATKVPDATKPAVPTQTLYPTTAPSTPSVAVTSAFEGLSSGLDNVKQARLRVALTVKGAPNVDVYVNGLPAMNGGVLQQNIGAGEFSGFLYVAPGTYTVALVPHGGTLAQALFEPVAVKVEAGHRYTVAQVGQLVDKDVKPLAVDETALEIAAGVRPANGVNIETNNVKGAPGIDELMDGNPTVTNIPYLGAKPWMCPADNGQDKTIVTGHPEITLQDVHVMCEPGVSYFEPMFNDTPTKMDVLGSQGTSELNTLDFLAGFNSHHVDDNGSLLTFNTLLAAIDKAQMRDQFTNSTPYMLLAPTDQAFAGLDQAQRDALLNDPQALTNLLNALIVDGYFPYGSFSGPQSYGTADRTVTNRLGQQLAFSGDSLNGSVGLGPNYTVGNGDRVYIVYSLPTGK